MCSINKLLYNKTEGCARKEEYLAERRELLQEADNEEEIFNCGVFVNQKLFWRYGFSKKVNKIIL